MLARRALLTANFLVNNERRPFSWGDWDCNLFVADLLDHLDGGLPWRSLAIRGKYQTGFGAARFAYHFTPAPQWLERQGYRVEAAAGGVIPDHAIILEPRPRFYVASLYFAGRFWAVVEDLGLCAVDRPESGYLIGVERG